MKYLFRTFLTLILLTVSAVTANAQGWPSNFEGVMLQGFSWGSYNGTTNTKWAVLEQQSDELSGNFKVIWLPNSGKCASSPSMGYDPVYWFTNKNSAFGNENTLKSMIQTFNGKGTDIIMDLVINHRSGTSNWTNFPTETWRGNTYKMGPDCICSTDEVRNASGEAKPTGAPDTGDDFDGSRDLDHTSATVQKHVKDYMTHLMEDLGYAGFRLDMVKGYGGAYTKIYNQATKPKYSVGEYWDGSYDVVARWIEDTGRTSAAFDYPMKYAINNAFSSGDMSQLCWMAGSDPQPAGLVHNTYARYSVTFVDNHDTYRDHNKFNGNVVAANAFILCSPGTPCVFWEHWTAHKEALKPIIATRNACGVHNQSKVKVLRHDHDCYMAEVYGTKGTLVVKIGNISVTPEGYTNADIKASGNGYCVWSKADVNIDPQPQPVGDPFNVYFDNSGANWNTPYIHYWGGEESAWPGNPMTKVDGNVWKYTVPAGTTGLLFNAGDGDATKTADFTAQADHIYNTHGDQGKYNGQGVGDDPVQGDFPANLYLIGNLPSGSWDTTAAVAANSKDKGVYIWHNTEILAADGAENGYFSFITTTGADWDAVNASDRFGSVDADHPAAMGETLKVVKYPANVSASSARSWMIAPGKYTLIVNLAKMTMEVTDPAAVEGIDSDDPEAEAIYFNLQGLRVDPTAPGIYIRVKGNNAVKVVL